VAGMAAHVEIACVADASELAAVAAETFPLACPPTSTQENIAAFVAAKLSVARFTDYVRDPNQAVLIARVEGRIIGYCMLIRGIPDDADVQRAVTVRPSIELSKMYVLPDNHRSGVSAALMDAALERASAMSAKSVWLGVNQENLRAQRFYGKHGFRTCGTKTFQLGEVVEHDYVMVRPT
jgi:ribosomal protein S18 acetylase RimI-like enzyme